MRFYLLTLLACLAIPAAGNTEEARPPAISVSGKQRLLDNIRTLEGNLVDIKENLATSKRNLATIRAELKDLESLEKEHLDLKHRYEKYLAKANEQINRNEKAKRDLAKWEASSKTIPRDA